MYPARLIHSDKGFQFYYKAGQIRAKLFENCIALEEALKLDSVALIEAAEAGGKASYNIRNFRLNVGQFRRYV